jgi:hypothetical protein
MDDETGGGSKLEKEEMSSIRKAEFPEFFY